MPTTVVGCADQLHAAVVPGVVKSDLGDLFPINCFPELGPRGKPIAPVQGVDCGLYVFLCKGVAHFLRFLEKVTRDLRPCDFRKRRYSEIPVTTMAKIAMLK